MGLSQEQLQLSPEELAEEARFTFATQFATARMGIIERLQSHAPILYGQSVEAVSKSAGPFELLPLLIPEVYEDEHRAADVMVVLALKDRKQIWGAAVIDMFQRIDGIYANRWIGSGYPNQGVASHLIKGTNYLLQQVINEKGREGTITHLRSPLVDQNSLDQEKIQQAIALLVTPLALAQLQYYVEHRPRWEGMVKHYQEEFVAENASEPITVFQDVPTISNDELRQLMLNC